MTFPSHPTVTTRSVALGSVMMLHLALGIAFLTAPVIGGRDSRAGTKSGHDSLIVELIPLAEGGTTVEGKSGDHRQTTRRPGDARLAGNAPQRIQAAAPAAARQPQPEGEVGAMRADARAGTDNAEGAPALSGAELQSFRNRLQRHIERYRRYPPSAQRAAIQGVVQVHFVMDRAGEVSEAWIELSSGSALLDDEAIAAIMRARPLPPAPAGWPSSFGVTLPIGFSLQ